MSFLNIYRTPGALYTISILSFSKVEIIGPIFQKRKLKSVRLTNLPKITNLASITMGFRCLGPMPEPHHYWHVKQAGTHSQKCKNVTELLNLKYKMDFKSKNKAETQTESQAY